MCIYIYTCTRLTENELLSPDALSCPSGLLLLKTHLGIETFL